MVEPNVTRTESQGLSPQELASCEHREANLHLNDPVPYEGWMPSEEQIRRFCEQLRSEPGWQEKHQQLDARQSASDDETIVARPDLLSFRRRKALSDLTTLRTTPIRPGSFRITHLSEAALRKIQ